MTTPTSKAGLEDVVVSTSDICFPNVANNRLIRPRAEYTGPRQATYVPIDRR